MPKMSYVGVEHTETETPLVMHAFTCQMCSTTLQVLATVSRPEEWFHWVDYVMSRTISFETT